MLTNSRKRSALSPADNTLVAWFTAAAGVPRVRARFLTNGVQGELLTLAENTPVGRVDTAFLADGSAVVSWLDRNDDGGVVRLAWFTGKDAAEPAHVIDLGRTSAGRRSGFPHIVPYNSRLYAVWTVPDADESFTRLELVAVDFTADQASR